MDRLQLVITCFLCAGVTIHAQKKIIQSDTGLPAVGILGSIGISATLVSAVMMVSVQKMQADLKICQIQLEIKMAEHEKCTEEGEECNTALNECNLSLQELQDLAGTDEDIDLIDGICRTQAAFCRCIVIEDETECVNEGCRINALQFCVET